MSLPTVMEVRRRIETVSKPQYRYGLMATYLFDARISEIVSGACPGDNGGKEVARGPRGTDARLDSFAIAGKEFPCVIFTVKTAKRGGKPRSIALPLEEQYEPWTKPLFEYYQQAEGRQVFPYTRQQIWWYVKREKVFEGLTYPIEKYHLKEDGLKKEVDAHIRPFALHALRHLRATELVEFYGFNGYNLSTYGGWTLKTVIGVSASMERYLSLSWQNYFEKLIKKRN